MGKLRKLSGKQVCAILVDHGFVLVRQRGSHMVMQLRSGDSTVTVPVPDHRELKLRTLRSIIRQSGVPRVQFETP